MAAESNSGARDKKSPQASSTKQQVPKSRWQLIVSGILCLFWLGVLAWLAMGG